MATREVLFEFIRMGNSVKVTATDTPTLTEISLICPARSSRKDMEALALRRLDAFIAKQADQAHAQGYEGQPCPACGKYTLKSSATRVKCDTCGRERRF
ncbi:MAG: hypothetical protein HZA67_01080 [Rhodospirillales bacterium]|jgi:ribonucleoside-diphosphate reductase alpha chain|nr:hypothetical protein [Rhodospirillales bacterium]